MLSGVNSKYVNYEDFGAIGDGVHDDFEAISKAHDYANKNGLPVVCNGGKIYFIGKSFTHAIPIEYDVDFGGSEIIIDDSYPEAFANRELPLFAIDRKEEIVLSGDEIAEKIGKNVKISKQDKAFPWITSIINEDSFIRVFNEEHRDFVRFGSNQNNGNPRQDIFIVKVDGTLDPSTEVAFEFDKITKIEIFPEREYPITVKNGKFATICCLCAAETNFENRWRGFRRGFKVQRADVTLMNIEHRMIDEPPFITDEGPDELSKTYAKRNESYPYEGFIIGMLCNRLTVKDCLLTSHTTYYEDKPATISTGWKVPAPVAMGTYDMYFHYSNATSLIGVKQDCPTGIADHRYWGIMASNQCKNFYLEGCYMNRFDSHRGFWNGVIKNSTIGHSINITGGGHLYMENVTKLTGRTFLNVRSDYGASFEGDIVIKNCRHNAEFEYNTTRENSPKKEGHHDTSFVLSHGIVGSSIEFFYNWDFGYELFQPEKIVIDNFSTAAENLAVYTDMDNLRFENSYNHSHALTKEIVISNMEKVPPVAFGDACTVLNSIKVTVE